LIIVSLVIAALIFAVLLCMIQVVRGATVFDRLISIDALTILSVGVLGLLALHFDNSLFLDIALVYAFVAFLGDLAVAKYLEGRGLEQ
jgi:multicomponent Na+:H+ antiporter subunit F